MYVCINMCNMYYVICVIIIICNNVCNNVCNMIIM